MVSTAVRAMRIKPLLKEAARAPCLARLRILKKEREMTKKEETMEPYFMGESAREPDL